MKASYGIFTTDGEAVAGTLRDEYAVRLAERLDESTASLYISTKNGVFLLGTTVNVQKKGRRPDTVIYLEKLGWDSEPLPEIDLAYIHDFYGRVVTRLSEIDYDVRDLASDDVFFIERHHRVITGLMSSDSVDYSVGRLLLGKEVVCVSGDLSKSVDFVVAVTERLHSFLSQGFTVVVAKRSFRDADLLVTEKYSGTVHINLATEQVNDTKWGDVYRNFGVLARYPRILQKISQERTRETLPSSLISEYRKSNENLARGSEVFEAFLAEEMGGVFKKPSGAFSAAAYEPPGKKEGKHPDESEYGKWDRPDSEYESLEVRYEEQMRKKRKARGRLLAGMGIFVILLAAVMVIAVQYPEFIPGIQNTTEITRITPSATIVPGDETYLITRLNTTPGDIPDGREGFGSAYEITVSGPQNVTIDLNAKSQPDIEYVLMRYNQSGSIWEEVNTTSSVTNESATALIPDSGIYRFFTKRESGFNTS